MNKIVVVVPVKNEEWILGSFLKACSQFADHVLIADQGSCDSSREIASSFEIVRLIPNLEKEYNEKHRAEMLVEKAREFYGLNTVIIALDADEVPLITTDSLNEWDKIRTLNMGTSIWFIKPDIMQGGERMAIDAPSGKPLGFVDDGGPFNASIIHTQRVPVRTGITSYLATNILICHVNLVRPEALRAKRRMYCVIENIKKLQPWWRRCYIYSRKVDFSAAGEVVPVPAEVVGFFRGIGFDLKEIRDGELNWQDYEVLRQFRIYGCRKFYFDDVWDCDWEHVRTLCLNRGWNDVVEIVKRPPTWLSVIQDCSRVVILNLIWIKSVLGK